MSGTTRRRRHPPAVYRRRRLTVLLALLIVIAAIWLMIAQPWRSWADAFAAASTPTPSSSETTDATTAIPAPETGGSQTPAGEGPGTETPTETSTPPEEGSAPPSTTPAIDPCRARDVTVEAVTDQDTYASGQNPQLSIRLTNVSAQDCTINVGTATQSFVISSGSDTWWRSTDCQSAPSDVVVTLKAGQSVASAAPIVWDRTRSSVSTCGDAERPRAGAGGASYHLSVEIGGFTSTQSKQFLLY